MKKPPHTMILVCSADDFRKYLKFRKYVFFLKNHKKYVISKMSSVFFRSARQVHNHMYFNLIKFALKWLIFFNKLFFAFVNPKIVN